MLPSSQRECMINAIECMYSKLPPEDEHLIFSKHVEDIYWNKFRKKVHLGLFLLRKFITMHGPYNVKIKHVALYLRFCFANYLV